jgi:16S rRNA (guanine527-N7)-methyltransferase
MSETPTNNIGDADWLARLAAGAAALGVPLDDWQCGQCAKFAALLRERNEQVNLTSITSPEGMLTLHMLDSLSVAQHLGAAQRVLDVGTGGGFPGIPLAIASPDREFTLLDGTQKKIRFVNEAIEALGLTNVRAEATRAENFAGEAEFDVIVSRALSDLPKFLHNAGKLLAPGGRMLAMKGRTPSEELASLPRGWNFELITLSVPGLDAERHLVALSRQKSNHRHSGQNRKPARR